MLFKNANIFVDGSFRFGSFRVENGRFTEILTSVPEVDGVDLKNGTSFRDSLTCIITATPARTSPTVTMRGL